MPVKSAGKQGQLELECGPNRHKTHLLFRYFFYLSSCFQTENLPWPDCQSRFLHKLTRFSLQKARVLIHGLFGLLLTISTQKGLPVLAMEPLHHFGVGSAVLQHLADGGLPDG